MGRYRSPAEEERRFKAMTEELAKQTGGLLGSNAIAQPIINFFQPFAVLALVLIVLIVLVAWLKKSVLPVLFA